MKNQTLKHPLPLRHLFQILFLLTLALGLVGCKKADHSSASATRAGASPSASSPRFRILAGSELKDVAGLVTEFGRSQNVNVEFEYTGTLDAVDRLKDGADFDAVWVSHGKYLHLIPEVKSQIKASEKTMYSRVVLGIKPSVAKALDWQSGKTGWADVVAAAKSGRFRFAMTNPTGSNTGFVALAGLAAELSGKGDALEEADIPNAKLTELFAGQSMTAGSSGVLADMVIANPDQVDGIINYESVVRSMAAKGVVLDVLIPKEGVITADYPLMLLANSRKPEFYHKLTAHFRSDAVQKQVAATTFRTPLAGSGKEEVVNELPFPGSLKVVDAILKGFLDRYSKPASSYFVLDVSGSMNGDRIIKLKQAIQALAQADTSNSGRFALFRAREHVVVTPFSDVTYGSRSYPLGEDAAQNQKVLAKLAGDVEQLQANGGTSIFSSIAAVYPKAQAEFAEGDRSVSIVLLTDGENTHGMRLEQFKAWVAQRPGRKVPVFAVLYGDAKLSEMEELAASTGGRVFDARKVRLERVLKDIRTYQ